MIHMYVARFPPKQNKPLLHEGIKSSPVLVDPIRIERNETSVTNHSVENKATSSVAQPNQIPQPQPILEPIRFSFQGSSNNNSSALLGQRTSSQKENQIQSKPNIIARKQEIYPNEKKFDNLLNHPSAQETLKPKLHFENNKILCADTMPLSLFSLQTTHETTMQNGKSITTREGDKRKLVEESETELQVKKRSIGRPVLKRKNGLLSRIEGNLDPKGEDFVEQQQPVMKRSRLENPTAIPVKPKTENGQPPAGTPLLKVEVPVSTTTASTAAPSFSFPVPLAESSANAGLAAPPAPFSFAFPVAPSATTVLTSPTPNPSTVAVEKTSPTPQQPPSSSDDSSGKGVILKSSIPGRPPPSPTLTADKGVARPFPSSEESSFGIAFNSKKADVWPLQDSQSTTSNTVQNPFLPAQPSFTPTTTPTFSFAFPTQIDSSKGPFSESTSSSVAISANPFSSAFSSTGTQATTASTAGTTKKSHRKKVSFR